MTESECELERDLELESERYRKSINRNHKVFFGTTDLVCGIKTLESSLFFEYSLRI